MDNDGIYHDLIANIFIDHILEPSEDFTSVGTYGRGNGGNITMQFKVSCDTDYYGLNCGTFCRDTNTSSGHFTCGSNGDKICLPGWSEPTTNCLTRKLNLVKL